MAEVPVDNTGMRIVRKHRKEALKPYTLELRPSIVAMLDEAAKKIGKSRQKTLGLILRQALTDKNFVLEIDD